MLAFFFYINNLLIVVLYNSIRKLYLMPGTSNNGGEHCTWSIISCKASFAHTRSVVNNEGGDFFLHFLYRERGNEKVKMVLKKKRKKDVL